nr:metallophosphoesterase family protein [Aphanothece sacrum]
MRILAIGDIHGCSIALDLLLEKVELKSNDRIVTLGDYVDKGPDSKGVLDRLIYLRETTHQLIPLKGNHEVKMIEARDSRSDRELWLNIGGEETLNSYAKTSKKNSLGNIPENHWKFMENHCLDWWETDKYIFVHANIDPNLPLDKQSKYELFWQKFCHRETHYSGKTMICGHTSQKDGNPINLGHRICIDTWACGKGWLSCLDVNSGQLWQTNQKGQIRTGSIEDFKLIKLNSMGHFINPISQKIIHY